MKVKMFNNLFAQSLGSFKFVYIAFRLLSSQPRYLLDVHVQTLRHLGMVTLLQWRISDY